MRTTHLLAAATLLIAAAAAACGGSSSKPASGASTPTAGPSAAATGTAGARGPGNRTPSSDAQTSIAEGTPRSFGNRTPSAGVQTSIAEGTPPPFGNRTPTADMLTAIAEGTPASTFRGGRGGGNILATAALVLSIDQTQLRTELQAAGATLASVAAAHGKDRAAFRQALIDATQQRVNDAVANGTLTQDAAAQTMAQFKTNVDSLLDGNGAGVGGGAAPPASAGP